jgi:hypothetical protein
MDLDTPPRNDLHSPSHHSSGSSSESSSESDRETDPQGPKPPTEFIIANKFIESLKDAFLNNPEELDPDIIERLQNPPTYTPELDPDERLSVPSFYPSRMHRKMHIIPLERLFCAAIQKTTFSHISK